MNQTSQALYEKNILSITRQVHYSLKNENSIDVVLFINGLPVATLELKIRRPVRPSKMQSIST